MNIAIVGGSGFIGSQTAIELLAQNCDVTVIDLVPSNISETKYIHADASDYQELSTALDNDFDYVYMFAAISDSSENQNDPLLAIDSNIVALVNVLQAVDQLKINRVIFSSTVWVYSVAEEINVTEETPLPITSSDHIYTTSKLTCEALIRNFHEMRGVNYTILRYGIAYGPNCHPDTILSKFMTNALVGDPLMITGNGSIYRNFLNVHDHARGNVLALSLKAENEIINLEGPEKITLARVADRVRELHGDVDIVYTDQREGDYKGKVVSNEKAWKVLDWKPTVTFNIGTEEMYEHIKKNISNSTSRR